MHKPLGTVLEESQDVLSTQILYRDFKEQDSECLSLNKKANAIRNMLKDILNPFIRGER